MAHLHKIVEILHTADIGGQIATLQFLVQHPRMTLESLILTQVQAMHAHEDLTVRFWARKVLQSAEPFLAKQAHEPGARHRLADPASSSRELLNQAREIPHTQDALDLLKILFERVPEPDLQEDLTRFLREKQDPFVLSFVTRRLHSWVGNEQLISLLSPFLKHTDDRVVANTIEGLEKAQGQAAIVLFAQLLQHPSHRVRANAAKAISQHDPHTAQSALRQMLEAVDKPNFVLGACHAARQIKAPALLPALFPLVANPLCGAEALAAILDTCEQAATGFLQSIPDSAGGRATKERILNGLGQRLAERISRQANPWAPLNRRSDSPMTLEVGQQRLFVLPPVLALADAEKIAMTHRDSGFGLINRLWYRPGETDIELIYRETRYEPFWHLVARRRIDYTRSRDLAIPCNPMVQEVQIGPVFRVPRDLSTEVPLKEHCREESSLELCIDAHHGTKVDFNKLLTFAAREIAETEELMVDETIVVPAKIKASVVLRESLTGSFKPVQADEINEEHIALEKLDLYFRPVYAFEFSWAACNKQVVYEIDGLTGELMTGKTIKKKLAEIFSEESLFEIGSEAAGLVIPGGELAMKLAKAMFSRKKNP